MKIKNEFDLLKYMVKHSNEKVFRVEDNREIYNMLEQYEFNRLVSRLRGTYLKVFLGHEYLLYEDAFIYEKQNRTINKIINCLKNNMGKIILALILALVTAFINKLV